MCAPRSHDSVSAQRPLAPTNRTSMRGSDGHDAPRGINRQVRMGLALPINQAPVRTHLGRMRPGTGGNEGGPTGTPEVPLTCSDESMGDVVGRRGPTVVRLENRRYGGLAA